MKKERKRGREKKLQNSLVSGSHCREKREGEKKKRKEGRELCLLIRNGPTVSKVK